MNADSWGLTRRLLSAALISFAVVAFLGRVAGSDEPVSTGRVLTGETVAGASVTVAKDPASSVATTVPSSAPALVTAASDPESADATPLSVAVAGTEAQATGIEADGFQAESVAQGPVQASHTVMTGTSSLEATVRIEADETSVHDLVVTFSEPLQAPASFLVVDDGLKTTVFSESEIGFRGQVATSAHLSEMSLTLLACRLPQSAADDGATGVEQELGVRRVGCEAYLFSELSATSDESGSNQKESSIAQPDDPQEGATHGE